MREYFSELYGNDSVKKRLGSAIEKATLPHAFLIVGPEGSGKKTLAKELAAAVNCENKNDPAHSLPCHKCNTCRRIADDNFTDITRLRRLDGKATIGVDEVRLFREDMFLSPTESKHKIYIIDEADKLTPNAQNALLTVLEEPPQNVLILLLADSLDKILTTIKSRAQSIPMQRFEREALREYLVKNNERARLYSRSEDAALEGVIISSDGRIGRAITLLSDKEAKENSEDRAVTERIVAALRPSVSYLELYSAISELPTARVEFVSALESLICAVRDSILLKFDDKAQLLFYTSQSDALQIAQQINTKRLINVYEVLKDALEDASKNVSTSVIIADLGARIKLM